MVLNTANDLITPGALVNFSYLLLLLLLLLLLFVAYEVLVRVGFLLHFLE